MDLIPITVTDSIHNIHLDYEEGVRNEQPIVHCLDTSLKEESIYEKEGKSLETNNY